MTYPASVRHWLAVCMMMVACMVAVGGATRLTESGLSIVEWKPISGTLPPMNDAAWQAEFAAYQQSPQYEKVNKGMDLEGFKGIFWLEYLHRLLGRMVGVIFFLPLAWFWVRRSITHRFGLRMLGIFALGGLQGALGWYMVKSGLQNDPWVSPLRLAAHLLTAFALFGFLLWTWLDLRGKYWPNIQLNKYVNSLLLITILQIFLGAIVAGNDAGLAYNTFPLMDGRFIPNGLLVMTPVTDNFFHNVTFVQFAHRTGAYLVCIFAVIFAVKAWGTSLKRPALILLALVFCQFLLGILTLLYAVPVTLGVLHQALALALFGWCVRIRHGLSLNDNDSHIESRGKAR